MILDKLKRTARPRGHRGAHRRRARADAAGHPRPLPRARTARSTAWRATAGSSAPSSRPTAAATSRGLYLAGGAAHPGPGMPMVLMSGWIAADCVGDGTAERPTERGNATRTVPPRQSAWRPCFARYSATAMSPGASTRSASPRDPAAGSRGPPRTPAGRLPEPPVVVGPDDRPGPRRAPLPRPPALRPDRRRGADASTGSSSSSASSGSSPARRRAPGAFWTIGGKIVEQPDSGDSGSPPRAASPIRGSGPSTSAPGSATWSAG